MDWLIPSVSLTLFAAIAILLSVCTLVHSVLFMLNLD